MRTRVAGVVLMALGAALAALPAFGWYEAPPVGAATHASGFSAAGQLWVLPFLGALGILAGALLLSARTADAARMSRRAGTLAAVAGAAALAISVWAAAAPDVELSVAMPDGPLVVPATTSLEPAAIVTPLVAGAMALVGLGVAASGRRR